MKELLNVIANDAVDFGESPELDQPIPGLEDTSLADLINPGESFQQNVVSPVSQFLDNTTEPNVDGLLKAMGGGSGVDGAATTAFRQDGSVYFLDVHFQHRVHHAMPINLGLGADSSQLPFGVNLTVDVVGEFTFDFTIGFDLLSITDIDKAAFIQVHEVSARAYVQTYDLNASLNIGFLEAAIKDGRIELDTKLEAVFVDPNIDGRLTLGELKATAFTDLVDLSLTGSLQASLPLSASLGGFSTSMNSPPTIGVSDTALFDTDLPDVTLQNFEQILDFSSFDADSILAMLRSLATRFRELGSSSAFNFQIPFTEKRLGDALDMGLDFVDALANVAGDPNFSGAQSLANQLALALCVNPSMINTVFNATTRELTYTIDYRKLFQVAPTFKFDAALAPIANIQASGGLAFDGAVDFDLTFGIDVSPVSAKILATATAPTGGNFSGEAIIDLQVGDEAPVQVRFIGTGNSSLADLIIDINAALSTAGVAVKAEAVAGKVQLRTTNISAAPTLRISANSSNPAVTALHLPATSDAFDNVANHIFIRDQHLGAQFDLSGQLAAAANVGFVGITGGLSAGGDIDFDYAPAGGARLGLLDLFSTLTNNPGSLGTPTLTGSSRFHIDQIAVKAAGIDLGLPTSIPAGQHQISVTIPSYTNVLPQLNLDQSLLGGLNQLRNMDFDDVLVALQALAERLVDMAKDEVMGVEIPGTGMSAGDLLGFAEDFLELVEEMKKPENRAAALENLKAKLQAGLNQVLPGVTPTLNMLFQNQSLLFQIDFIKNVTKSIDLNLDLGGLGAIPGLPADGSLLEVSANETLPVSGGLAFHLEVGLDLTDPFVPKPFIGRSSTFGVTAAIASPPLNLDITALGIVPLFVRGGAITLDQDGAGSGTGPAAFTIDFPVSAPQRLYLSDTAALLNQLRVGLVGGLNVNLPLKFPDVATSIDALSVQVPNLAELLQGNTTHVSATAPDLNALLNSVDLLTVLRGLGHQFDFVFEKLDNAVDKFLNFELPLVGVRLNELPAFGFLNDLASVGSSALSGQLQGNFTFASIRQSLQTALNNTFSGAQVTQFPASPTSEVKYAISLGSTITTTLAMDSDLGLAALGLNVSAGVQVALTWSFQFTIGANLTDGVFFDVSQPGGLDVNLNMSLVTGSMATGTLGFLQMKATDSPTSPTHLSGTFNLDLLDPDADDGKITLDELADLTPATLDTLVDVAVAGSADAHLKLELSSIYDLSSLSPLHLPPISLPRILADLDAVWNLNDPTRPSVGFGNVKLDLGSFFKVFGGQAFDTIDKALDPIRPVLDVLSYRIPVLSDIGAVKSFLDRDHDGKVTLLDAAALLGGTTDTRMLAGVAYVADLIESITTINSGANGSNSLLIPLPDLSLSGQDVRRAGGLDNFQIPSSIDSTFNLTAAINTLNSQGAQGQNVAAAANTFVQKSSQTPSGLSFSLPLLKNPSSALGLLLGKDVDLFRVDLPALDVHFSFSKPFPIFPPINGLFAGSMDLHADLAFGYDTAGLREFRATGFDTNQKSKLANGFFIYDRVDAQRNPTDKGTAQDDKPEVSLTGVIAVGASAGPPFLHADVTGDITANVTLDLPDGDQTTLADGRTRFNELAACGINVAGTLSAGLEAKVVLEIPVAPDITLFKKSIGRVTLLDFTSGCNVPNPLATLASGVLTLNVGNDQDERVTVTTAKDKNGASVVRVQMFGVAQEFPLPSVSQIVANFGGGNDSIAIDPQLNIPATLDGGVGNDILAGGSGNDVIRGGDGNDQITGGPGNDQLLGQAGNDQLDGDEGHDQLFGGVGDDDISGGDGDDYALGNVGNDTLIGGDGTDSLYGDHETDDLESGNDSLDGGPGNDTLVGGPGSDTIQGADGSDSIRGDTVSGLVPSGTHNDALFGDAGHDTIEGGVGQDTLTGGIGDDLLYGHSISAAGDDSANDQLYGQEGNDQLFGQGGDDTLEGDTGDDQLFGGNNNDTLRGQGGADGLHGGGGNDQLFGGEDNDLLEGDAGADTLRGDQREDRLFGHSQSGAGDDAAADTLFGDQGADELHGNAGNDALHGGTDDDVLFGETGNDTLEGDAGDDQLRGGANEDQLFGHSISGASDDASADELFGDSGNDTLHGNAGPDELHGDDGDDTLYGDAGRDLIEGNSGSDIAFGGAGEDQLFGHSALGSADDNAADTLYGDFGIGHVLGQTGDARSAGRDELFGQGGNDTLNGEEFGDEIQGGGGLDTIRGGAGRDIIDGDSGDDQIFGGDDNDRILGNTGNDTVHGDAGDDEIYGNAGTDVIHGDAGDDRLMGDAGEDMLRGGLGNDLLVAGAGIVNQLFGDEGDDRLLGSDEGSEDPNLLDATFFGDVMSGGSGDDQIFGLGGSDDVDGGDGDDWVDGGVNSDRIRGGTGRDTLYGSRGNDLLEGGNDNDRLYGEEGADTLRGDDGNDYLDGGVNSDTLLGGDDQDELVGGGGIGDQLFGESGADVLHGSDDGADVMQGGPGRDRLMGHGGNDNLSGDDGDDVLLGGDGDDQLAGDAGQDILAGEADHDTLYGHNQAGSGDDNSVDYLYGDFATNDNEARSGQDRLFGNGGNDLLFGEAGDDFIDAGTGSDNTIDFGTGDGAVPNNFVPPVPTLPPAVLAHVPNDRTASSLPTGLTERGRWQQLAGSASGLGLSGNVAGAIEPTLAVSATGQVIATWSDARNGNYEIYVARWDGTQWTGLAGSHQLGGVSNTDGSSQHPSLTINANGQPIVAWLEAGDIRAAQFDPTAVGGQGAWVALGNSLSAGGISGTGTADHPVIVNSPAGPTVAWLNTTSTTTEVRVQRFDGTTWNAVGTPVVTSAPAASNLSELSFATDGTKMGLAWTQLVASVPRVYAMEFAGTAWQPVAGSNSGNGISTNNLAADQPTIAVLSGELHVAWRQQVRAGSDESDVFTAHVNGASWEQANTSSSSGMATQPKLAVGGGQLHLAWAEDLFASGQGSGTTIYATRWNGSAFVERFVQSGDLAGGMTGTGDGLQQLALAVSATGAPLVAWSNSAAFSPQIYVRGDLLTVNRVIHTSAALPLSAVLGVNTFQPGDIVMLDEIVDTSTVTLTAAHSGIFILGAGTTLSHLAGKLTLNGANNVTISRVDMAGGFDARLTNNLQIVASRIGGSGVLLNNTTNTKLLNNVIESSAVGVTLGTNTGVTIEHNSILGATMGISVPSVETNIAIQHNQIRATGTGLSLKAALPSGSITDNDIQATTLGVDYAAVVTMTGNRIHHAATGVKIAAGLLLQSNLTDAYDRSTWSSTNQMYSNQIGVELQGFMQGQIIRDNTVGVVGTGLLGPTAMTGANLIYRNTTGVDFAGVIQFNRIEGNNIGVKARSDSQITHNQFVDNVTAGLVANNVADVQISHNTLVAATGDNIRIENLAREVEVRGNSMWVEQGVNLFVADNARSGFFSDYNQLHATGTGKLVHWMRDFTDILDWQADVHVYDLHSIGTTIVNPDGTAPAWVSMARGDYRQATLVGGLRMSSPGVDGADSRNDVGLPLTLVNLLTNPSFEVGTAGWTTNVGATAGRTSINPFQGNAYLMPGSVATGVAEQTINLLTAGFTTTQLDSQSLVAVFGGRVRSQNEAPIDTATLTIAFKDGLGNTLSQQTRSAANVADRWDLVGDRLVIPVGSRQITYRFESLRSSGTSNDAYLDNAFVYVLSEATAPDYGVHGNTVAEVSAGSAHLALTYPDLYIDWQRDVAKTIRWQSYNNSTNSPVRIDLLQDGPHGPQLVNTIASSTPDDGEFIVIPANLGVNFDTLGLRVQVSLVTDPMTIDRSQESFTVPDNSLTYFVDDGSNANDEYTSSAVGSNRNTGKRADVPKPHPVNLLRAYDLPPGAIISIDTGTYPLFDALRISGAADLGLGLEEGFTMRGPIDTARHVTLQWIYPDNQPQALVELRDADFVTLSNLDLIGSQRGLWVTGGSDNLNASFITSRNQTLDAIDISGNHPGANFVGLVAENAGRNGIVISSAITSLTDGRASNNADRGLLLTGTGNARIEAMEINGNRIGIEVSNNVVGTQTLVGNSNLALGRGNKIHDNLQIGVFAFSRTLVAGNTVSGQRLSSLGTAIQVAGSGTEVLRNVVFDNQRGIVAADSAPVRENRVYGNLNTGIIVSNASPLLANVVYDNTIGIAATAIQSQIANNLIYDNATFGLKLSQGSGPQIVNNTIYTTTGIGLRAEAGLLNMALRNNVIWATGGVGVSVASDSQTGLASDFNLLLATGTGAVGNWLGFNQSGLQQWQLATGQDANSLANNPLFVDEDGADNILGYVAGGADGSDDDFHLQSQFGSLHGGSLAPIRSLLTGLPTFSSATLVNDANTSPAIDRGAATDPVANEPLPSGGFINIGHDGNTGQASRSAATVLMLLDPNGGELIAQGSTFPVRWRANGFAGNVKLEVSSTGSGGPFQVLAADEPNDGEFSWLVSAGSFPASTNYFLRLSSVATPSLQDVSDAALQIAVPTNVYFVNDGVTTGDEYSSAPGSGTNTGLSATSPLNSIQAVLNAYDLGPGDVILVDTGVYSLTANIVIDAADSGVRIQGPVQGTHQASLNRNNTATGSHVFQLQNATNVTLDSLEIFGANEGVLVNLASHDFTITNSTVRNNSSRGIHIEDTANRAVIADNDIHSHLGFPPVAVEIEGDDAIIRNNVIRDNSGNTGIAVVATAANTLIQNNDLFGNGAAINTNQPTGVPSGLRIEANSIHGNAGNFAIVIGGAGLLVNNEVFNNNTTVAVEASGDFTEVRNNRVFGHAAPFNSPRGIRVSSNATARGNTVFGNTNGFEVSASKLLDNLIYSNGTGVIAGATNNYIAGNVIYANTSIGIDSGVGASSTITNNTLYQLTGDAIRSVSTSGSVLSVTNNILVTGAGAAFNISESSQVNFVSDYNLFQVTGAGRVATWNPAQLSSWEAWQFATGNDRHSLQADPQFVDADGPDNILGNTDDNFQLTIESPARNVGDPLALYAGEPTSGNIVDLGAFGNSSAALASSVRRLQLVEPTAYRKIEQGQTVDVRWVTAGLTNAAPVLLMDAGGPGMVDSTSGRWSAEAYRSGASQATSFTQAVNTTGLTNPPPQAVLQSLVQSNGNSGQVMRYALPLADGDYQIRLFFVDPTSTGANQRKFDVNLQGQTVLTNYDIFAEAGAIRKAVARALSFTASLGSGLDLSFINRTGQAMISGFEITRADASDPSSFGVHLEFSANNGLTWSTIASNLPSNRFGEGQFTWTANQTTSGHTGLFRATAVGSGLNNITNTTTRALSVSTQTNVFYVNAAGDSNFSDNEYATAAGNDLNNGTSPSTPLASLNVLLQNYVLTPGDTINIDSGIYTVSRNIELTAEHSGIRIQGPVVGTHAAVFNRGNLSTNSFLFHLRDATNVTLDSVELVGAREALRVDLTSHDVTLSNSVVRNNFIGVHVIDTANRAVIRQNEMFANSGTSTLEPAVLMEGDDGRIEGNVIRNNAATGIFTTSPALNAVIRGNDIFGNAREGVFAGGINGLIEQNSIHANATNPFTLGAVQLAGGSITVQDNEIFGNSRPGVLWDASNMIVQRNVIHDNTDGIIANFGPGVIRDNRIYHNSLAGIRLRTSGNVVSGNTLYANASGVVAEFAPTDATIINNLIYDHTIVGIDLSGSSAPNLVSVRNNTIFEPTSIAVRLNTGGAEFRNNILSTASGTLYSVPNDGQAGFVADYNLLQVSGSGKIGLWGTDSIVTRIDWIYEIGRDQHSLESDPQFIDIDGIDGRRGYDVATSRDFGADDDFHETLGSPAVDAGDPLSHYSSEPVSGNRVNVGAFGNTAQATASATLNVQLTSPVNLAKFEVGQMVPITWLTTGFSSSTPIAMMNAGGAAIADSSSGRWGAEAYRTGGSIGTVTGTIDTSLLTSVPPLAVLQSFAQSPSSLNGGSIRYDVPLPDGQYNIRLIFVEPTAGAVNQRKFDVALQSQTALANYDIFADAGAVRKATQKSFTFTAAQGTGLRLELINRLSFNAAIISGFEITKANPTPINHSVNLEYSNDNGATWTSIATNLPANRFGEGSFLWSAPTTTVGNTGRIRATVVASGLPGIADTSQPFSIANNDNAYYVNLGSDSSLLDNEFTSSAGDNANSGKSAGAPMKSLAALLRAYDLDAGDTIFVDSGAYKLLTNVSLGLEDSGVTIQGPTQATHSASLNRANTSAGNYGFELVGGVSGVTIDDLEIFGAEDGVHVTNGTNIEIRDSLLRNNANRGVYVETTGSFVRINDNQIQENSLRGVEIRGSQVTVGRNLIRNSNKGIHVNSITSTNVTLTDNQIFGHTMGIDLNIINAAGHLIQGNSIHDNATHGINLLMGSSGTVQILGNEIYGQSDAGDVGIFASGGSAANTTISANRIHHNFTGIQAPNAATLSRNWIYANSSVGINFTANAGVIRDNQIYNNATGILYVGPTGTTQILSNLIYSNSNIGIDVSSGNPLLIGNTVVQAVGTAMRFTGSGTGTLANNIVQATVGTLLSVATGGQASFVSNRNLLYPASGSANVGLWGATVATTLANWQSVSGRDANSVSADPLFVDVDGADNVLGEQGLSEGNGFDDNFGLRAGSPAIDRGDGTLASSNDALGRPRRDDLNVANNGTGTPNFVDLGALEFQGSSSDTTPPTITAIQPAGVFSAGAISSVNSLALTFSEPIDQVSANSPRLFQLVSDGIDNLFDTGDDVTIVVANFGYLTGSSTLTLGLAQTLLAERYRLTALGRTGQAIIDQAGNALDGDANGGAGGDFVRVFTVANSAGPIADNDPSINQVAENAAAGTLVGITVRAVDPDVGDTITYSLDDSAGGRFAIQAGTGVIVVAAGAVFDAEAAITHSIIVRATSSDGSFSTTSMTIAISDVDEFDVSLPTDTNVAPDTVNENVPDGTLVGITAVAVDADRTTNAITYSLDDSAAQRFGIQPASGIVYVASGALLNRELAASHSITVRATSADGSYSTRTFTIAVTDVDEFDASTPVDVNTAANLVSEKASNGTLVGITANAFDADATQNAITYQLFDSAGGRFAIGASSGVVTVANNSLLNFGLAAAHTIIVRATSADGSVADEPMTINIIGNRAPTAIQLNQNTVIENTSTAAADLLFGQLSAVDPDPNESHTFQLVTGAGDGDNNRFRIVGNQIFIKQGELLDFETKATYSVRVRTSDSSGATLEQTLGLSIQNASEVLGNPIVGDGTAQRSLVKSIIIEFDSSVTIQAGAFQVNRRGVGGGAVDISVQTSSGTGGRTLVTLQFSGALTRNGALLDGNYELTILGSRISGWVGPDYKFGDDPIDNFYAYFGDTNGDRQVGVAEFGQFRSSFGKSSNDSGYNPLYDYEGLVSGTGSVGISDFGQFRSRFGKTFGFE